MLLWEKPSGTMYLLLCTLHSIKVDSLEVDPTRTVPNLSLKVDLAKVDPSKVARDVNTEIATSIVPVRAVNFSIGPFCAEFRCERFCDDEVLWDRGRLSGSRT